MSLERRPLGKFLDKFKKGPTKPAERASAVPISELSREISGHILVNKEDQAHLMAQVTERIHDQLKPIAAALDAMYKDNLQHPENLLMKDKKGNIQFIIGDLDKDERITVVSMKGHTIETPDGKKEPGCKSAIFCKTSKKNISYYKNNFMRFSEKTKFVLPFKKTGLQAIAMNLDKKDKIRTLAWSFSPLGHRWIRHYSLSDNQFSVLYRLYNYKKQEYIPDQEGSFKLNERPCPEELKNLSIEQEIQHIIAKLPLEK